MIFKTLTLEWKEQVRRDGITEPYIESVKVGDWTIPYTTLIGDKILLSLARQLINRANMKKP